MAKKRCTAIVLAAGSGSRMKSTVAKQYLPLAGKPLICHALQAVEKSTVIDDCILVTGEQDMEYVRTEIVEKYNFHKVVSIVAGGAERYLSVANALEKMAAGGLKVPNTDGYVFIHDGARPFLTETILQRMYDAVTQYHACVAAMPVKDTVKIADENGFAVQTPGRRYVWAIQTPQVFDTRLIQEAYRRLKDNLEEICKQGISITDDAGVVERFTEYRVKLVEGDYSNIKVTTPEDIQIAETLLSEC